MNKNFPNLKCYREALGLTQLQVAKMLNCTHTTYSLNETGVHKSRKLIAKAWDLFNSLSLDYSSLQALRCLSGLTRSEVAKRIGYSYQSYWLAETGKFKSPAVEDCARALFRKILEAKDV